MPRAAAAVRRAARRHRDRVLAAARDEPDGMAAQRRHVLRRRAALAIAQPQLPRTGARAHTTQPPAGRGGRRGDGRRGARLPLSAVAPREERARGSDGGAVAAPRAQRHHAVREQGAQRPRRGGRARRGAPQLAVLAAAPRPDAPRL
eukprot:184350-Prymnesium_polylepis.1